MASDAPDGTSLNSVGPGDVTVQACAFFIGGRFEDAADTAQAVLGHQPHNLEALLVLTAAQQEMGLDRRARATAQIVKDNYPALDVEAWVAERPYQDPELTERWRRVLSAVDLIGSTGVDGRADPPRPLGRVAPITAGSPTERRRT